MAAGMEQRLGFMAPRRIQAEAKATQVDNSVDRPDNTTSGSDHHPDRLRWDLPAGWARGKSKSAMRFATFALPGGAECYLVSLGGNGGGTEQNINRWRGQMGLPPLDGPGLAALTEIRILGNTSPILECYSVEGKGLIATFAPFARRTMFVKLVGSESAVSQQAGAFAAFCRSLRVVE